jgi:predicted transcriptional regulator
MVEPEMLAPREKQVFDLVYQNGPLTVAEVVAALPDELSASAVRAMLKRLKSKNYVTRKADKRGFTYSAAVDELVATQTALNRIVDVFFDGSPVKAANALLGMSKSIDETELDELQQIIADARKDSEREE